MNRFIYTDFSYRYNAVDISEFYSVRIKHNTHFIIA